MVESWLVTVKVTSCAPLANLLSALKVQLAWEEDFDEVEHDEKILGVLVIVSGIRQ